MAKYTHTLTKCTKYVCSHFCTVVGDASPDSWLMNHWPFSPVLMGISPSHETAVVCCSLTLWFSPELWLCGSAIQTAQERRETAYPESKILHPSPIPLHFPSLFYSLIVFTVRLFVRLICSLSLGSVQYGGWVLPEARKVSKAVSTLRKFKVWNCRTAMGADSSPILIWKAAATVAELKTDWSAETLLSWTTWCPRVAVRHQTPTARVWSASPPFLFFSVLMSLLICVWVAHEWVWIIRKAIYRKQKLWLSSNRINVSVLSVCVRLWSG